MTLCVRRQQDAFPITYLVPEFIAGRGVIAIAAANLHEAHEAVHWIFYFNTTRLPKRSRLHLFQSSIGIVPWFRIGVCRRSSRALTCFALGWNFSQDQDQETKIKARPPGGRSSSGRGQTTCPHEARSQRQHGAASTRSRVCSTFFGSSLAELAAEKGHPLVSLLPSLHNAFPQCCLTCSILLLRCCCGVRAKHQPLV